MSEGKYPDKMSSTNTSLCEAHIFRHIMKKYINIKDAAELLDSIACGKRVEGVLFKERTRVVSHSRLTSARLHATATSDCCAIWNTDG